MLAVTSSHISKWSRLSKTVIAVTQTRHKSSIEAKPEYLNKNMSFRSAFDSPMDQEVRPVSIIYGWLVAKAKHMHKYGDFYLGKGYDVLHVKIHPDQMLWPKTTQKVIQNIVDFVDDPKRKKQPILVHGFSVGGYLYGETLVKILEDPEKYGPLGKRIVGQILDSPVDFEGIPDGFSKAVTPVPILQTILRTSLQTYLSLFKRQTVDHYKRSAKTFYGNTLQVPSLMLYSSADPVGTVEPIQRVIKSWENAGADVYEKCWNDSPHVSHFHYHPVQYIREINTFLDKIGINTDEEIKESKNVMKG